MIFTSPMIPASSRILLLTNVRLGTQNMENSCSTLPFCCRRLICSIDKMSAHSDGIQSDNSEKESLRDELSSGPLDEDIERFDIGNSTDYVEWE